jgi:hypothetical protein
MGNMKKLKIYKVMIIMILLSSCTQSYYSNNTQSKIDNSKPYYQFDANDNNFSVNYNYQVNQIITYENQIGEQLHFIVISNITKRATDYSNGILGNTINYYYDRKTILFEIIENHANYPIVQVIYAFSKGDNVFKNGTNFPIWNVNTDSFIDDYNLPINIYLNNFNNQSKIQMTINGYQFEKVVIVESNSNVVLPNYAGLLPKNVNKLYYDYNFGIIEFIDVNGKDWKIKTF